MSKLHQANPGRPARLDKVAKRNDTFIWQITMWSNNGKPYDLTDHNFLLQVKETPDSDPVISMEDDSFIIDQDEYGASQDVYNVLYIRHPASLMNVAFKCYYYDLEMTTPEGDIQTIYEGSFTVTKDMSQEFTEE